MHEQCFISPETVKCVHKKKKKKGKRIDVDAESKHILRASALDNAKPKCRENLAFQVSKSSPSENAIGNYYKYFCNSAIVQF